MKTVVQLESFSSIYNSRLQNELLKNNRFNSKFELEVINFESLKKDYEQEYKFLKNNIILKILFWVGFNSYLKKRFQHLKGSVLNIQYVSMAYCFLFPFISSTFPTIVLSFWGSDLLREKKINLLMLKPLINKSKYITLETNKMKDIFEEYYTTKYSSKIKLVKFGISIFDKINAITNDDISIFCDKYKVDNTRKIICVGYNRNPNHQHIKVIESFIKNSIKKEKIFLIFPWTYGPDDISYKEQLINMLSNYYDYIFIEDRMTDVEIACLRVISDVLVQVQTTDSFSSTMLETLYAQNEVLTGGWLPYKDLLDLDIKMELTKNVDEVGGHLKKMIENPLTKNERINNAKIVSQISSWEKNIDKWISLYE